MQTLPYSIQHKTFLSDLGNFGRLRRVPQVIECYSGNAKDRSMIAGEAPAYSEAISTGQKEIKMFTNRSLYLIVLMAILVITACAPQAAPADTAPPPTLTVPPATFTPPPTAVLPTASLGSTAELFEGRLLFSRYNQAAQSFTGMYIARTDGSDEIEVPLPWTQGWGSWSRSGTEIALPTLLADERVGTAIIDTDGTVLRELSIPDATLNLVCVYWSRDETRLACEG